MSLKLEIGKPVYLLAKEEGKIIPGVVCEQKNVLGSKTPVWTIMIGPESVRKLITTDKFNNDLEIVTSLYELRDALFKQAAISVNASVAEATNNMKNWYIKDVGMELLAPALKLEKPKSDDKFTDAKGMSFADIVGKDNAENLKAATKKRGRKKVQLEPVQIEEQVQPSNIEDGEEDSDEPIVPMTNLDVDDPNFKIRVVSDDGTVRFLSREELEKELE